MQSNNAQLFLAERLGWLPAYQYLERNKIVDYVKKKFNL